jgi:hypothetical protein
MNKKTIIEDLMQSLKTQYEESAEIKIHNCIKGWYEIVSKRTYSGKCSNMIFESEGLYYSIGKNVFFYEGEPKYLAFGGNREFFILDDELLDLVPKAAQEILKRVASTGENEIIEFTPKL